jgi:hypothetical protein
MVPRQAIVDFGAKGQRECAHPQIAVLLGNALAELAGLTGPLGISASVGCVLE